MGKQGIRYAAKIDLEKPAAEQSCLHVLNLYTSLIKYVQTDNITRTAGTLTV
jgi:hypothetical protein